MENYPLLGPYAAQGLHGGCDSSFTRAALDALHRNRLRAHRVFALLCIFDALFTVLLWALVCQVGGCKWQRASLSLQ